MTKNKPKGPVPSLIGSTLGTPKLVTVERKSECKRCKGEILKGETCAAIPQLGGTFANPKRYCKDCYTSILEKTNEHLEALKKLF